ncbi:hypothetical protein Syun_001891 [Stephania yunnanensis]|uniref:Uncharacterized protein n=1 Tax=Stephania yunnanensis TaxID=152371 RepID=A0AAP0QBC9_9MAGN
MYMGSSFSSPQTLQQQQQLHFPPSVVPQQQQQRVFYTTSKPGSDKSWYADSWATSHFTADQSQLYTYALYRIPKLKLFFFMELFEMVSISFFGPLHSPSPHKAFLATNKSIPEL